MPFVISIKKQLSRKGVAGSQGFGANFKGWLGVMILSIFLLQTCFSVVHSEGAPAFLRVIKCMCIKQLTTIHYVELFYVNNKVF